MELSEMFKSVQGEGKRSGVPSFFIRTNYCNLRCRFTGGNLCDTPYTSWDPSDSLNIGKTEVSYIAGEFASSGCRDVVITGGEPAMQKDELLELCIALRSVNPDCFITLETNGTVFGEFARHINLASISQKLLSSVPYAGKHEEMHLSNMLNTYALKNYAGLKEQGVIDVQWKFVFTGESDVAEILKLKSEIGMDSRDIYLMPEGITREQLEAKRDAAVTACLKHGFNYTDRLHILIWGNKRGV